MRIFVRLFKRIFVRFFVRIFVRIFFLLNQAPDIRLSNMISGSYARLETDDGGTVFDSAMDTNEFCCFSCLCIRNNVVCPRGLGKELLHYVVRTSPLTVTPSGLAKCVAVSRVSL